MKQRGQKSAASLAVIKTDVKARPEAPETLTEKEKNLWISIVDSRDPEFFDAATIPLLTELCRLKTQVDLMSEELEAFNPDWLKGDDGVKRYKTLCGVRDQGTGRLISLATRLRLTPQARYVPAAAKARATKATTGMPKLWDQN